MFNQITRAISLTNKSEAGTLSSSYLMTDKYCCGRFLPFDNPPFPFDAPSHSANFLIKQNIRILLVIICGVAYHFRLLLFSQSSESSYIIIKPLYRQRRIYSH